MYWLTFVVFSLVLYLPPLNMGQYLWRWTLEQEWHMLLTGWPATAWLAYVTWLTAFYLLLATAGHLLLRRLPPESRFRSAVLRLSQAGLGTMGVLAALAALLVLLLAWPGLPAAHALCGWQLALSVPVAYLAGLYLLAEALRMTENNIWLDRAFAAQRTQWLIEHGYDRS